ncbi:MAG: hypothetical protein BWY57_03358 [Betaproteobacteria bacterium ADurb.Bin341]|nr:MAG: hypothetical protein BWY57_03358 [Betaproteobacteria bacterium ADurb.Bin341]
MEMGLQKGVKAATPECKTGVVFRFGPRGRPRHPQAPACAIPPVCKQWKTRTVRAAATQDSHQASPSTTPVWATNLPPGSNPMGPGYTKLTLSADGL